jgi:hypothetical protein
LRRQEADLKDFHSGESILLDPAFDFSTVEGISGEVRERLNMVRPTSIVRDNILFDGVSYESMLLVAGCSEEDGRYDAYVRCVVAAARKADECSKPEDQGRHLSHRALPSPLFHVFSLAPRKGCDSASPLQIILIYPNLDSEL